MIPAQYLIVILAAFLLCGGWLIGLATSPDRLRQAPGEVYGVALFMAALFILLSVLGIRYVAPILLPMLRP